MKNYIKLVLIVAVLSSLFSCKNTLDVNAPWKETTVIYGLLNVHDSVQYIKINKAFLGNGNELSYAKVPDSINYGNQLTVTLQEYNSGNFITSTTLLRIENMPKDTGIFANIPNVIYRTPSGFVINPTSTYLLSVKNSETGNTITGSTAIVNDIIPQNPSPFTNSFSFTPTYLTQKIKWNPAVGGIIYNFVIRFYYDEKLPPANTYTPKYVDWSFGNLVGTDTTGNGSVLEQDIVGLQFFQFIASAIPVIPNASRMFDSLGFTWTVGSQDLYTYIQVYQPSIGIVQEKPQFTNLTGGIGIFSSRNTYVMNIHTLSGSTLNALDSGTYTANLGFHN